MSIEPGRPSGPGNPKEPNPAKKEGAVGSEFKKYYIEKVDETSEEMKGKKKNKGGLEDEEEDVVQQGPTSPAAPGFSLDADVKKAKGPAEVEGGKKALDAPQADVESPIKKESYMPTAPSRDEVKVEETPFPGAPAAAREESIVAPPPPPPQTPQAPSTPPIQQAPIEEDQEEAVVIPPIEEPEEEYPTYTSLELPSPSTPQTERSIEQQNVQENQVQNNEPLKEEEKDAFFKALATPSSKEEKEKLVEKLGAPSSSKPHAGQGVSSPAKPKEKNALGGIEGAEGVAYNPAQAVQVGIPESPAVTAPFLSKDAEALMLQMIGKISYMKEKTISGDEHTTRIELNHSAFANSKFYNAVIEIKEYSTARGQFQVEILFDTAAAEKLAEKNVEALIAAFQGSEYVKKNMTVSISIGRKPVVTETKRISKEKKDKDQQNS